jgi:PAS domain S-box-containing protein
LVSADGSLLQMNPAGLAMIEAERFEDVQGGCVVDLVAPDDRASFRDLLRRVCEGQRGTLEFDLVGLRGTRRRMYTHGVPYRQTIDSPLVMLSITQDITERVRAEQARRKSDRLFRMVWDNSADGKRLTDATGTIVRVNPAFCRMMGQPREALEGQPLSVAYSEDRRDHILQKHRERFASRTVKTFVEIEVTLQSGEKKWFAVANSFLELEQEPTLLLGVFRDITERKRVEEERRRLEMRMLHTQKLESLGVLAGGIAHDFNNLLTSMLGFASLALVELPEESVVCPMLRQIEKAALRAADLAGQMLAYSGQGKFVVQTLRLDALVGEMSNLLETVVSKKALLKPDLSSATTEADATQIRQVVMNLITNASDSLEGRSGVISVRTGVRQAETDFLRSPYIPDDLPAGRYAYLEVEDTGCGMTEDTLTRLFDPFFTTKFTGRGLGLAAVLGIVRGHRGTIKVKSEPRHGTVFQVFLPASEKMVPSDDREAGRETSPTGKGLVLVVDDEEGVRSVVRRILQRAGYRVTETSNGVAGLRAFRDQHRDITAVLLDVTMPGLDGPEVLIELRKLRNDVPVLMISGYGDQDTETRLGEMGATAFLKKPFQPRELVARLEALLDR